MTIPKLHTDRGLFALCGACGGDLCPLESIHHRTEFECPRCKNWSWFEETHDEYISHPGRLPWIEAPAVPAGWKNSKMNPWVPTLTPHEERRFGKTGEEVSELAAVLFRCFIQGYDEIDPSSGKTNRQRFFEELADVQAQINCNRRSMLLPAWFDERVALKEAQMGEWGAHYPS